MCHRRIIQIIQLLILSPSTFLSGVIPCLCTFLYRTIVPYERFVDGSHRLHRPWFYKDTFSTSVTTFPGDSGPQGRSVSVLGRSVTPFWSLSPLRPRGVSSGRYTLPFKSFSWQRGKGSRGGSFTLLNVNSLNSGRPFFSQFLSRYLDTKFWEYQLKRKRFHYFVSVQWFIILYLS